MNCTLTKNFFFSQDMHGKKGENTTVPSTQPFFFKCQKTHRRSQIFKMIIPLRNHKKCWLGLLNNNFNFTMDKWLIVLYFQKFSYFQVFQTIPSLHFNVIYISSFQHFFFVFYNSFILPGALHLIFDI